MYPVRLEPIVRFAGDNIARVLQGQPIGTLVHRAANTRVSNGELNAREESPRRLQTVSLKARMGLSYEPEATETKIIHENEADVAIEKMVVTRHL
ncbi:delta-1-pyrroline-5-carboxylate synthase [Artemisia annua]|uniref:Delta-1-pyrroline-5-carboxylate synthase n=1 Tax=Artemisia annua TaxID=35608 RepID=A0A2U1QAQ3_ARTAN|nr:delta-1-pyrroline-5-carboxylate synthase [Artemisia annua]